MPFCRHCGDLVLKDRCGKCGGKPVAASFSWNPGQTNSESPDRWKQTYTMEKPVKPTITSNYSDSRATKESAPAAGPSAPARRFPRPQSTIQSTPMNNRISEHISATTSERTPTNKHAKTASLADTLNSSPSGNPVLDDGVALSKVYGSVLQNPDTLKGYACASCDAIFTRDATLYPDPDEPTRMLCRHCFVSSSGTKGECATCHKPVVRLRQEGQYVENSGRIWHKKCFLCDGCSKNIAERACVDLYGRPCCPDCFDTSLQRPLGSKPTTPATSDKKRGSIGGLANTNNDEGSPVMDELSRRLRIQSKEPSPTRLPQPVSTTPIARKAVSTEGFGTIDLASPATKMDDLTKRLQSSTIGSSSPTLPQREANDGSPSRGRTSDSRLPILSKPDGPFRSSATIRPALQPLNTPDLTSDASDIDSTWPSPPTPRIDPPLNTDDIDALCDKCQKPLFSVAGGGRIVTVPSESGNPARFHSACFVCAECEGTFIEKEGAATFVVSEKGLTHLHCAPLPKPKVVTRQRPMSVVPIARPEPPAPKPKTRPTSSLSNYAPRPVSSLSNHSASSGGGFTAPNKSRCAGCDGMVAVMEPGVVPGPNGTRWHSGCLVCGGKGSRRRAGQPGCGKKLDRDAKLDREGKTWCSNCMTLLILNGSISSAPLRTPVSATFTGGSAWLSSQGTGSSVASHSTGSSTSTIGASDKNTANGLALLNRRSGSTSPTKGMFGGTVPVNRSLSTKRPIRPRPKSVSVLPTLTGMGAGGRLNLVREITGSSVAGSDINQRMGE